MAKTTQNENVTPATENTTAPAPDTASESTPTVFVVLLPTDDPDTFTAKLFDSKKAIGEAIDLEKLPTGIKFIKGKELAPKVKTIVKVSL